MKKLFKDLKKYKGSRRKYRTKPFVKFTIDKEHYHFSFLPTVLYVPWIYRHPNSIGVIDIWWMHFHILIGKWESLSCRNCKHQEQCVKSKKLEWYSDDIFEKGEKCSEFEAKY